MIEIELWCYAGFVAVVDVLPQTGGAPDVVIWGTRTFKLIQEYVGWEPPRLPRYAEIVPVMSLTPSPGRPRKDSNA